MKNISKIVLIIAGMLLLATGCIKETFPTSVATTEQIGASTSALEATVRAMPAQLVQGYLVYGEQEWEFDMAYPGLMIALDSAAGEIIDSGNTGYDWYSYWSSNDYGLGETTSRSYVPWRTLYMFVKNANDVIGAVDPSQASPAQLEFLAQALVYRAFAYLAMVQIYEYKPATDPNVKATYVPEGDITGLAVPIVTEKTTGEEAKNNPRATVQQVYDLIFSDLGAAQSYLAESKSTNRLFPTLPVVYGLMAKAHLARLEYADAATYARKAIDAFGGSPLTQAQWEDPINGFNNYAANSNSWMWYIAYSAETMGNLCNFVAHMSAEETWTAYGWAVGRGINKNVYDLIPDTDFRKHSWIDPLGNEYYKYKTNRDVFDEESGKALKPYTSLKFRPANGDYATYKVGGASHVPLMRLEEMMLIEAEGLAMSGHPGEAVTALEGLIQTRDPQYTCKYSTPENIQKEIYFQKRVEFWGEGIIFFDAKRLGAGVHNGYVGTNVQGGYRFNCEGVAPWWNWVIPQSEINGNPALKGFNNPNPSQAVKEWE